jgi:hypothetical protein
MFASFKAQLLVERFSVQLPFLATEVFLFRLSEKIHCFIYI